MASMNAAGRPRNLPPTSEVDVRQIIQEAQTRWLRPVEVCEILRNYRAHNFKLNPVPPQRPQSGSLFLFDRKALRYFRKDGHNWRKKKDGKTVREAHERLKAGSVDVLHCYYAHGEDNVNFQRRCYWMLDQPYEHIVLVHYREVTENNRSSCIIRNTHDYTNSVYHPPLVSQHQHVSPAVSALTNNTSLQSSVASPDTGEGLGPYLSPEPEEADSEALDEFEESGLEIECVPSPDLPGPQLSLQQQLGDQQISTSQALSGSGQWQSLTGSGKGLGVIEGQFAPHFPHQEADFKAAFTGLQQHQRVDSTVQGGSNSIIGNFPNGDVNSIRRRFADVLDSPGPSHGTTPQRSSALNTPLDLAALTSLMSNRDSTGNGALRFTKPPVNSPTWAELFSQVTTPSTRKNLLATHGLPPGLGQPTHVKDAPPPVVAPLSPKGIMDALSPRNLGRVPQTPLEANLRAVTEKEVLKEAEEKAQARSNNRWQTAAQSENFEIDIHRPQDMSGAHQMSENHFIEPDTLEHLVRSGQSQDKSAWIQHVPQRPEQPFPNFRPFEQQATQMAEECVPQEKSQLVIPTPQTNGFSFMDNAVLETGSLLSPTMEQILKDVQPSEEVTRRDVMENFKKLDSFGRWMNTEIVSDGLYLSAGSSSWESEPLDIQMDGGLNPSTPQQQCFNISDYSPEWGSSSEETKVLIAGTFGEGIEPSTQKWACMFGEIEVPAELVEGGSLRCKAPKHRAGVVNFYVTRSDRFPCSQIKQFDYRSVEPVNSAPDPSGVEESPESVGLLTRFARMLFATASSRTGTRAIIFKESEDDEWKSLQNMLSLGKPLAEVKEQLIQLILRKRLQEWLQVKGQEEGKGASVHDDRGQGLPHLTAGLGYVWSIAPLLRANIPINFRDDNGWTALHYAAFYGREEVVVALLNAGAEPNCRTYCTKQNPQGVTAADLASMQGHNGLAAFLSQNALTTRLQGLNLEDGIQVDENAAAIAAEKAVEKLARRSSIRSSVHAEKDQLVLENSLEAVRVSIQTAAKLKDAFRQQSIRRRQMQTFAADEEVDEYGLSESEVRDMLAAQKIQKAYRGHVQKNKKLHLAATAIQRKYRGWKGRKDFQAFRQRIIKLQAHVRGRLVRKQFRKIIWSVSIVEKVVLRWLRKRNGLRGFRSQTVESPSFIDDDDNDDIIREGRHRTHEAVEKDVQRVQLMPREKAAREQYNRLCERSSKGDPYGSPYSDQGSGSRDFILSHDSLMTTVE
ncbi:hypothetical protein R1flu_025858 [Riccia fluitans]|uniref:CG-1 domain-containing protein n=1 Tax=Riccia fluitans TaxID=41844 RepID=A0ABD1XYY0_9MARC